jgi:serine/threonine-protein kinase RsbW
MEHLTVPGTLESLEAIADYVAKVAAAAGLDDKTSYRLHLAVDEIVTNVIAHGYDTAEITGVLELWADIDEKTLSIWIEDTGRTYDPRQYRRPHDLGLPPDQRRVGGLGVYLALQSVDRFHYERVGNRNRHTLIVERLPS